MRTLTGTFTSPVVKHATLPRPQNSTMNSDVCYRAAILRQYSSIYSDSIDHAGYLINQLGSILNFNKFVPLSIFLEDKKAMTLPWFHASEHLNSLFGKLYSNKLGGCLYAILKAEKILQEHDIYRISEDASGFHLPPMSMNRYSELTEIEAIINRITTEGSDGIITGSWIKQPCWDKVLVSCGNFHEERC